MICYDNTKELADLLKRAIETNRSNYKTYLVVNEEGFLEVYGEDDLCYFAQDLIDDIDEDDETLNYLISYDVDDIDIAIEVLEELDYTCIRIA